MEKFRLMSLFEGQKEGRSLKENDGASFCMSFYLKELV